jgi:hypothetical protein
MNWLRVRRRRKYAFFDCQRSVVRCQESGAMLASDCIDCAPKWRNYMQSRDQRSEKACWLRFVVPTLPAKDAGRMGHPAKGLSDAQRTLSPERLGQPLQLAHCPRIVAFIVVCETFEQAYFTKNLPAGAKARTFFGAFAARLKSCPVTKQALYRVFRQPLKSCPVITLQKATAGPSTPYATLRSLRMTDLWG